LVDTAGGVFESVQLSVGIISFSLSKDNIWRLLSS
jgi:hypothetical protein